MASTAATLAPSPAVAPTASPTAALTLANVAYEKKGAIAYVTVNRPKVLNALNTPTWADLRTAFEDARDDAAVRGVILTGAGDKAFIAGADIGELAHATALDAEQSSRFGQEVLDLIENLGKPVIAAVNGFALGGGCETAMACTIRIAVDTAKFGQPEVKLGLLPGGGGTQRLPRLVGKGRALQLILSGGDDQRAGGVPHRARQRNRAGGKSHRARRGDPEADRRQRAGCRAGCRSKPSTREWTPARARASHSKPPISASAPRRKTRRRALRPSWRSGRPSSTGAEDIPLMTIQERPMASDNIFSGLKVVDLASFIAGPSAAVILSDFGADVVKVEPPTGDTWRIGHKIPPQPQAKDAYPFHLANRNKRGITLDLKSPSAQQVLERLVKWADVLIVNTPHPARKRLKLEYDDVVQWNPRLIYADLTGFGEKGPDADLPGFDITSYWARSGLLSMTRDAGEPPTWPVAGSGDNATAVGLYSAIVTALYRRERTGKGSYVTTSLLAEGVWSASVSIQAALCEAKFFGPHDRKNPANAALNVYRASDGTWFVLIVTPDKLPAVAKAIGRADLLTDPRFSDPAKLAQNMAQLTAIFDEVFGSQPMTHWYEVFNGVHVTFGAVRGPQEVINDPQLRANDIVVPLEGAGGKLTSTISSPIQVHGVTKVPAKRARAGRFGGLSVEQEAAAEATRARRCGTTAST